MENIGFLKIGYTGCHPGPFINLKIVKIFNTYLY